MMKSNNYIRRYTQNNFLFNYLLLATHLNLSDSRDATDLVMRQHYSRQNAKEFVVTSHHIMPRPIISRIANANPKCEHEHVTRTLKRTRLTQDICDPTKHHHTSRHVTDMSRDILSRRTTKVLKNNFGHETTC